jgi:hydrogenase expression/formation protein HypD
MFQFREKDLARKIIENIKKKNIKIRIMHVCGTHQDTLVRHGLDQILFEIGIDMREGPGCPVCVATTKEIEYARQFVIKGKTLAVYGDMLRAPGVKGSLETERASGGDVIVVYSIEDALKYAIAHPKKEIVFFGVGFETTIPSTAVVLSNNPPKNFQVFSIHRLTPPAVKGIAALGNVALNGLILPGHVSAIIGSDPWQFISDRFKIPQVVTGFEPLDLLMATFMIVKQLENHESKVEIEYQRVVKREGNIKARKIIEKVFDTVDLPWRGFSSLPQSGMKLKHDFEQHDSERTYEDLLLELKDQEFPDPKGCRCGEVIRGEIYPWDCPLFGKVCVPEKPVGSCMVSSEGACAIEYKYGKLRKVKGS